MDEVFLTINDECHCLKGMGNRFHIWQEVTRLPIAA
jgi:hypothetical protein